MKKTLPLIIFIFLFAQSFSRELIVNGGFESGTTSWKLGHAFSETTGKPIQMTSAGDGWLLLNRPANESFIRFDLDSVSLATPRAIDVPGFFNCFPNPTNEKIAVNIFLQDPQIVQLNLVNLMGKPVKVLLNDKISGGFNNLEFDVKDLAKNTYFLVLKYRDGQITRKVVII